MGLFDRKKCDICGADMGLIKDHKASDGAVCNECYNTFSPYLGTLSRYTIDTLVAHKAYREENYLALNDFNITAVYGDTKKLYVDDEHGWWLLSSYTDFRRENCDIFTYDQIVSAVIDIEEVKVATTPPPQPQPERRTTPPVPAGRRNPVPQQPARGASPQPVRPNNQQPNRNNQPGGTSQKQNPANGNGRNGNFHRYMPMAVPVHAVSGRYDEYKYNIYVEVTVNHPWFTRIRFKTNTSLLTRGSRQYQIDKDEADEIVSALITIKNRANMRAISNTVKTIAVDTATAVAESTLSANIASNVTAAVSETASQQTVSVDNDVIQAAVKAAVAKALAEQQEAALKAQQEAATQAAIDKAVAAALAEMNRTTETPVVETYAEEIVDEDEETEVYEEEPVDEELIAQSEEVINDVRDTLSEIQSELDTLQISEGFPKIDE